MQGGTQLTLLLFLPHVFLTRRLLAVGLLLEVQPPQYYGQYVFPQWEPGQCIIGENQTNTYTRTPNRYQLLRAGTPRPSADIALIQYATPWPLKIPNSQFTVSSFSMLSALAPFPRFADFLL
ncbi:hypothetical protein EDB86DRAFT_2374405 [Lactarius hatsudake]|nr:hypothetical protein EDB86DRAFT_2374405 [Lactarius hatsudake]